MSIDPDEAENEAGYEAFIEELYEEHKEQAIYEFVTERLRSYYLSNPEIAIPVLRMYKKGQAIEDACVPATVVFYVSATEIAMKSVLLQLVVYGLVHNESLAGFVVEFTVRQSGFDRFRGLLLGIL